MKKNLTKLVVIAAIGLLVLCGWGVDSLRTRGYAVTMESASPVPAVADGQTPVTLRVKITHGDDPCGGHVIYVKSLNGGSFKANRVTTGADGVAEFIYYPYLKSRLNQLTDVNLCFADESNSLFVSVPARLNYLLKMVESADGQKQNGTTNDSMFG